MESFLDKRENLNQLEKLTIPIKVHHSAEHEISRIRGTIDRYRWYAERKYRLDLPQDIKKRLEKGEEISGDEIKSVVVAEYQDEVYLKKEEELKEAWEIESVGFLEKLGMLGRPLPEEYNLSLTRYGTGGSYTYPNVVQLNLSDHSGLGLLQVALHEIVHLTIEDLIRKYEIPHWTKERLVDLIMNRFFPDKAHLQRNPENAEQIGAIFDREFPNIEKIIEEVSKISRPV